VLVVQGVGPETPVVGQAGRVQQADREQTMTTAKQWWGRVAWDVVVRRCIAAVLTVLAFGPSLQHIHDAAAGFGAAGWVAWASAASVDLLAVYAGLVLKDRHRAGVRVWDPLAILLGACAVTIAAQVVTAQPTIGGVITAVWPALCFLGVMALVEGAPDRVRPARKKGAKPAPVAPGKPQVSDRPVPASDPAPAPVADPVRLHSVTPPTGTDPAPAVAPGEDRDQAVSRWAAEGWPYMVMVRAVRDQFGVSETTAKRAVGAARKAVAS
jgi:Protein of unknown function (DUF2637)